MSAKEILKKEYPLIYETYVEVMDEQFELFAKKHLDYGMGNVSAGSICLFPASFTHLHRGNPPLTGEKYIITGWLHLISPEQPQQ